MSNLYREGRKSDGDGSVGSVKNVNPNGISVGGARGDNVETGAEETGGRVNEEERMETGGEETGGRVNVEEMRGENVETGEEETAGVAGEEMRGENVETGGEETAGRVGEETRGDNVERSGEETAGRAGEEEMRGENVEMGGEEMGDRVEVEERGVNVSEVSVTNSGVSENRENPEDGNSVENVESQQMEEGSTEDDNKEDCPYKCKFCPHSFHVYDAYIIHVESIHVGWQDSDVDRYRQERLDSQIAARLQEEAEQSDTVQVLDEKDEEERQLIE